METIYYDVVEYKYADSRICGDFESLSAARNWADGYNYGSGQDVVIKKTYDYINPNDSQNEPNKNRDSIEQLSTPCG